MKRIFNLSILAFLVLSVISCKSKSGDAVEATEAGEVAAEVGASYNVDATVSKLNWEGSKPAGKHNGTVNVASGVVSVDNGQVSGGNFVVDMTSINCLDLEGDEKAYLEAHLMGTAEGKETDFFNVAVYPTATFEITKVAGLENDAEGNALVYGNLTLKDITKQVAFKANVNITPEMVNVTSNQFTINRTDWDIKYGSKTFFDNLKDKFIDDNMSIAVNLVAKK
jgi:polyisoprenoid-binding protein YceI